MLRNPRTLRAVRTLHARLAKNDEGFGLAELLVYSVLSVVILTICAQLFISAMTTRQQVTDLSEAASTGQLISSSIQEGVRNASGPLGSVDAEQRAGIKAGLMTATGQLLRARVAVGAVDGSIVWRCQAWFFSPETEAVYSAKDDAGTIEDPIGFTIVDGVHTPTAGSANWTLLGEGVRLSPTALLFFGEGGDRVVLSFVVTRHDVSLVLIPSTVVKRTLAAGGTGPTTCY